MENVNKETQLDFPLRFQAFLDAFGLNPSQLATQINKGQPDSVIKNDRVKFGRWLAGRVEPSLSALRSIAMHYDVDMNWFLLNEGPVRRSEIYEAKQEEEQKSIDAPKIQESTDLQVIKLLAENEGLRKQAAILETQNDNLWRLAFSPQVEKELGFLQASSHTTAADHMPLSRRAAGFRQHANDDLLEEILNEVKILPLDSSDCKVIPFGNGEGKQTA